MFMHSLHNVIHYTAGEQKPALAVLFSVKTSLVKKENILGQCFPEIL